MALPREAARGFRDIEFGFADAHKEGAEAPDLPSTASTTTRS
jgi:hypothetical protein